MKKNYVFYFIISLLFLNGCATLAQTPIHKLNYKPVGGDKKTLEIPCCKKDIEITYLGASGFLIKRGDFAVLTAPFFSNPNMVEIGLATPIYPNTERIDDGLYGISLAHVKAIFVGHAHYDHLMDVPYVVKKMIKEEKAPEPKIYGSITMKNLLLNEKRKKREIEEEREVDMNIENIIAMNSRAATFWTPGEWVCLKKDGEEDEYCNSQDIIFRFMAIKSEHAPHFAGLKFFGGVVKSTNEGSVTTGKDWKEGQTFTYVMDFLGTGKTVDLRIHFQDATSNPPAGFLPILKPEDRTDRVDIAILCVAGYKEVKNYPEGIILNLKPRYVILSHWENFFEPLSTRELKVVRGTDSDKFIWRLKQVFPDDERLKFPKPKTKILFNPKQS